MGYYVKVCGYCNSLNDANNMMCANCKCDITSANMVYYGEEPTQKEKDKMVIKSTIRIVASILFLCILVGLTPLFYDKYKEKEDNYNNDSFSYVRYDQNGNQLDVYVKFKNNAKEDKSCGYSYFVEAYQNGEELNEILNFFDDSDKKTTKIEPGKTIEVIYSFQLNDDSLVTVKGKEMWTNDEIFRKSIYVK